MLLAVGAGAGRNAASPRRIERKTPYRKLERMQ